MTGVSCCLQSSQPCRVSRMSFKMFSPLPLPTLTSPQDSPQPNDPHLQYFRVVDKYFGSTDGLRVGGEECLSVCLSTHSNVQVSVGPAGSVRRNNSWDGNGIILRSRSRDGGIIYYSETSHHYTNRGNKAFFQYLKSLCSNGWKILLPKLLRLIQSK